MGIPVGEVLCKNPSLGEDVLTKMLAGITAARKAPPGEPVEHWAVSEQFTGIERAGLVVVNIHDQAERVLAQQLVADVHRLRKDEALFKDILTCGGYRIRSRLWSPTSWTQATQVDPPTLSHGFIHQNLEAEPTGVEIA